MMSSKSADLNKRHELVITRGCQMQVWRTKIYQDLCQLAYDYFEGGPDNHQDTKPMVTRFFKNF